MIKELNPEIIGIDITDSMHYSKNRATVLLEISDGNGGREKLTVEYPIQGNRHLTMLMTNKETGESVNHLDKQVLSGIIKNIVENKEQNGNL